MGDAVQEEPKSKGGGSPAMMWMSPATQELPPGCVKGLEPLLGLATIFVRPSIDTVEMLAGYEEAWKYDVFNSYGQRLFMALEKADSCQRLLCPSMRAFELALVDSTGVEMMHLSRAFHCQFLTCFTSLVCLQQVTVTAQGETMGTVRQRRGLDWIHFDILSPGGECVLRLEGSGCCILGKDDVFVLRGPNADASLGRVCVDWSPHLKDLVMGPKHFGISFPADLDVKTKATVLAAAVLIDFMFYDCGGKPPKR